MFKMRCMPKLAAIALTVTALIGTLPASPAPAAELKSAEALGGWVGVQVGPLVGHCSYRGTWTHT